MHYPRFICAVGLVSLFGFACVDYKQEAKKNLDRDGLTDLELKEVSKGSFEFKARRGGSICKGTIGINKSGSSTNVIKSPLECRTLSCTNEYEQKCKNWCKKGEAKICWLLGTMYSRGRGVAKSPEKAVPYLQKACDGKYAASCNDLADLFVKGEGVKKDLLKAIKLFEKACDQGFVMSCANLGLMYHSSNFFGRQYPRKAAKFLQRACDKDHAGSCGRLAMLYADGSGVAKDVNMASKLYEKACDGKVGVACVNLGLLCEGGSGFPEDLERALRSYEKACKLGTGCPMVGRAKRFIAEKKNKKTD